MTNAAALWGDETAAVAAVLAWADARVTAASDPKATARPASELAAATGPTITPHGIGVDEALRIFTDVLVPATRAQDDPMNLAYVPTAPTRSAIAFDLAVSAATIFAGTWEAGAGAIHAENQAIAWLVELLGWPATAGGCFVSGGTTGNLSALVTARHAAEAAHGRPARWKLAATGDAHSSVRSAARVMDIEIVDVEGDDRGRLTGAGLERALARADDGDGVFAVVASGGTTNAGVVDELDRVADVCGARGIWLHVDGAYGGAALAAPSARARFSGIERADSFVVDPHKWLFAPYDCCALVYRDPSVAQPAHTQRASYLELIDHDEWNPADYAVHLSRRPRGLPFWFSLAVHGTDRYRAAVESALDTARAVAGYIAAQPHLELIMEPDLSVLLFRRVGWTAEQYQRWSTECAHAGTILCVPTRWKGETMLRLVFVNPATQPAAVCAVLDSLA